MSWLLSVFAYVLCRLKLRIFVLLALLISHIRISMADDKEVGISSVDAISYRPTDADIQKGVVVRFISSKRINAN